MDAYRDQCDRAREFCAQHELHPTNAYGELAAIVQRSLAETGSAALFLEVEEEVRRIVLRGLRHYKRTGARDLIIFHSANCYLDEAAQARAAIGTLAAAGLVSASMTRIAAPLPKFMGLELIRGIAPLQERRACGDALLDIELVALAQDVPDPRGFPLRWTMKLLITEHEHHIVDANSYRREPVRSCVATFAMHKNVSLYFWPRFSFGYVERMRVIEEQRRRGQSALVIKLDLHGKGRLTCRDMELLGLEEISCAMP